VLFYCCQCSHVAGHRAPFGRKAPGHPSYVEGESGGTVGYRVHRSAFACHHMASTLNVGQAAKLHPCLYDYDAFWPVHEHLKRHLVSTRDKYRYIDPDLVALNDAEAAARGESRPPPRKKRQTVSKWRQHDPPRLLNAFVWRWKESTACVLPSI
jgi:hypothetical protein